MDKPGFTALLSRLDHTRIRFTGHFDVRNETRNIGKGRLEDFLLNRPNDLTCVEEDAGIAGTTRIRACYRLGKRKALFIVADLMPGGILKVVTSYIIDARLQKEAVKNANRYARFAKRLRR